MTLHLLNSDKEITMNRLNFTIRDVAGKNRIGAALAALLLCIAQLGIASQASAVEAPQDTTQEVLQLDINSADAITIAAALEGVGMVRAQDIVAYRDMYGKFRSIDELAEVQGIGSATIEKNRHRIVIISN
jgi:competence protein ComEA